jgi:predicted RNA-binding protein YlqC (UPF0109 family)
VTEAEPDGAPVGDDAGTEAALLEFLTRGLVDRPDDVSIDSYEDDDGALVLELSVADDDYGKVIGRGGRTAGALRTVIKAAAAKGNRRVFVDIVE